MQKMGVETPDKHIKVVNSNLAEVTAMTFQFELAPSASGESLKVQHLRGELVIPKAYRLTKPLKDKPELALTVTLKDSARGHGTTVSTIALPPIKLEGNDVVLHIEDDQNDWIPAPVTGSYSITVRAFETGRGKAYAAKLAELLKKLGGKGVEEGVGKLE